MGCRILHDEENGMACLYCSTGGEAFGPVFRGEGDADAAEVAELFLTHVREGWNGMDPRALDSRTLEEATRTFWIEMARRRAS